MWITLIQQHFTFAGRCKIPNPEVILPLLTFYPYIWIHQVGSKHTILLSTTTRTTPATKALLPPPPPPLPVATLNCQGRLPKVPQGLGAFVTAGKFVLESVRFSHSLLNLPRCYGSAAVRVLSEVLSSKRFCPSEVVSVKLSPS